VDATQKFVPGAVVVLVPSPRLRDREDLYATSATDETGRFQLRRLPPGDYELYAWPTRSIRIAIPISSKSTGRARRLFIGTPEQQR